MNRTLGVSLGLCCALLGGRSSASWGQTTRHLERSSLEFLGFRAGAPLAEVASQVSQLGGRPMRCDRARKDPSVSECRATLFDPETGQPLELWMSAMDSLSGILTLSGPVTTDQVTNWKSNLVRAYGEVGAQVQGPQWMMQWVRRGRMIRLTWRFDGPQKIASVSLVDGRVLDAWGNRRSTEPPARPARPESAPIGRMVPAASR